MKTLRSLLLSALLFSVAHAQVPGLMNYQAQVTDAAGVNLATGTYTLHFRVYDAATGGNLIWGPQSFDGTSGAGKGAQVPVVGGFFNVILGPQDTAARNLTDAFNGATRYLEIQVGANPGISPRQQILSAPYALKANQVVNNAIIGASLADNAVTSAKIGDGTIATADLADNAVTSAKIGDGTIATADLADNAVTSAKIGDGTIADADIANVNFGKINGGNADVTIGLGQMWSNVRLNLRAKTGVPYLLYFEDASGNWLGQMYEDGNFGVKGTLGCTGSMNPNGGIVMGSQSSISGVDLVIGADDLRFRPTAAITKDTIYVTSDGRVRMNGANGDAAAFSNVMLSVGKATNGNPAGDYSLWLTGGAVKPGGGGFGDSSDARLKKDVTPVSGSLEKVLKLRSVAFKFNELDKGVHGDKTYLGFLAQEVEPVFPDWVMDGPNGYKMLNIQGFESLAVQALRELRAEKDGQIKSLQDKLAAQDIRLAELEAKDKSRDAKVTALEKLITQPVSERR